MSIFSNSPIGSPYKVVTNVNSGSSTTLTATTLLHSILIPANTFSVGDIVTVEGMISKNLNNGTITVYLYWNTSVTLTGAILVGTGPVASATYIGNYRQLNIRSATNNTICVSSNIAPSNNPTSTDMSTVFGLMSTLSINWTSNGYFILAASHTASTDTVTGEWMRVSNF